MPEPIEITDDDMARRVEIVDTWKRYDGVHPASLKISDDGVDDNVTINDLATVLDTGVDFLTGSGQGALEVAVMKGRARRNRPAVEHVEATDWLDDVLLRNRKRTFLRNLGTSGAVAGQFAMKIVPDTGSVLPVAGAKVVARGMHRVVLLDPMSIVIQTYDDDIDLVTGIAIDTDIEDECGNIVGRRREQHTLNDDGKAWTVEYLVTDSPVGTEGVRVQWAPDPQRRDPVRWPHPFSAIITGQNLPVPHQVWGRPDLTPDILHLQEAINRVASNENVTLRRFAHPLPYGVTGPNGGDPKTNANGGFTDATIGAMSWYAHGTEIKTLPVHHEGLAASAEYRDTLTDKLFEIARVPRIAAGKVDNIGSLSGVAMLVLYRPLIAKTETKRDTYGDAIRDLCQRLLVIAGFAKTVNELDVVLTWPDVIPKDMAQEAKTARDLDEVGLSKQTNFERLGIDWDQERARLEEEASDPMGDTHGLLGAAEDAAMAAELDDAEVPQVSDEAA